MSDYQNIGNSIIKNINLNHYISGQITSNMMQEISDFGITLIINNRPDNEEIYQESSEELKRNAEILGIKFINIPFSGNTLTKEKIITFSSLIKNNEEKSLFFCRSGARSATIWGISSVIFLDSDIIDVMSKITNVGYDSSFLPNMVEYFKNN